MPRSRPILCLLAALAAAPAAAAQRRPVAIVGATVIARADGAPSPGATVVVRGGRVVCAGLPARCPVPRDALRIDGAGRWVVPGLFDAHVHVSEEPGPYAALYVAFGVTSVRDVGGRPDTLRAMIARIDAGREYGPRIHHAARPLDGDPPRWAGGSYPDVPVVVRTPDEARAAVRAQHAAGASFIKLYLGLTPTLLRAASEEAQAVGLRTTADLMPWRFPVDSAVDTGLDGFEHMMPPPERDLRIWTRDSARADAAVARAVARGMSLTTTISLYDRWTPTIPTGDATYRALPPTLQRRSVAMTRALFGQEVDYACRTARAFARHGGAVLAGTDSYFTTAYPGDLHRELELLVGCGLTSAQALMAGTLAPARWLGLADVGHLAPGARADLVLLRADPLADIRNTRQVELVIAAGRLVRPEDVVQDVQRRSAP